MPRRDREQPGGDLLPRSLAREFSGAKRKQIATALESLEALGIVVSHGEGDGEMWTALRPAAHQRRLTPISV